MRSSTITIAMKDGQRKEIPARTLKGWAVHEMVDCPGRYGITCIASGVLVSGHIAKSAANAAAKVLAQVAPHEHLDQSKTAKVALPWRHWIIGLYKIRVGLTPPHHPPVPFYTVEG